MRGAVIILALSLAGAARAEGLEVGRWLDRPGVKLVVVEVYATWCKPCMAAAPKWQALHQRYRKDGLRLIVVATQDPQAGCANPGWAPDEIVCDADGAIAAKLGVAALPAAFLWSWQGHLLVRKGHVEEVDRAIREWMSSAPRLQIEVEKVAGADHRGLEAAIRAELKRSSKLEIIASERERAKLARLKLESFKPEYDESLQCELGKELSANSLLTARVAAGAPRRLHLTLLSAESGCLVAGSAADFEPRRTEQSVAEAVAGLLQKLRPEVELPVAATELPSKSPEPKTQFPAETKPSVAGGNRTSVEWTAGVAPTLLFGRTEVTVAQFRACVQAGSCVATTFDTSSRAVCNFGDPARDQHPMNCVNWLGADAFCRWAGARLPTDEEWQAEASAGGQRRFPWGAQAASCDRVVMQGGNVDGCDRDQTWPVCSKPQGNNVSGLCDLSGNVWEWTSGSQLRGGSWISSAEADLSASGAMKGTMGAKGYDFGFRCVRNR